MLKFLLLVLTLNICFSHSCAQSLTNGTQLNDTVTSINTRMQTIPINDDPIRRTAVNPIANNVTNIGVTQVAQAVSKLEESITRLNASKELDLASRLRATREQIVAEALKTLQVNLDKAVLALEEKINTLQFRSGTPAMTSIADKRNVNMAPVDYRRMGMGVYYELRTNEGLGLPKVAGYAHEQDDGYSVVKTIVPWGDTFGGFVIQLAYAGREIRTRNERALFPNVWTPWRSLIS